MILVESFSRDRIIGGPLNGHPFDALIEDPRSGLRWLVASSPTIPLGRWHYALSYGAVGVLVPSSNEEVLFAFADSIELKKTSSALLNLSGLLAVASDIPLGETKQPNAGRAAGFVHLHAHSEFSPLDGLATVQEMVDAAVSDGQPSLAITDHGVCAAHPELSRLAAKAGIKPIFGIEANFVNAKAVRQRVGDYWHLILWATSDAGLKNLWAASTEAYREGFYGRARMDWETLDRYNEGLMASTACLRGPLSDAILADDEATVRSTLSRMQRLFPDRLFVELHTNQLPEQRKVNQVLVELAHEFSLPTIVVADSHYACREDHDAHKVWIAAQTNKDLQDEGDLFAGDEHYHVSSEQEVRQSIAYLGSRAVEEAVANTLVVADRCHAKIVERHATPVFHRKVSGRLGEEVDAEALRSMCEEAWQSKISHGEDEGVYRSRFEEEMDLLVSKKFCGYLLLVADYCRWAKAHGILMGPGRGSAAGSLVCYLLGITEVDPIAARLLFERFLTPARTSLPDIDSDFPASRRDDITNYIAQRWGEDRVVRVGTHIRLANRGVMRDVARVLESTLNIDFRDVDAVSKIIEEAESSTAGLGLTWDELWAQHGDVLAQYKAKYPVWFAYAERLVGRLKSYGRHAAGVVIDPEESIVDRLPLRVGEHSDQPITEFAMNDLEYLGYVKFDILTLRTLDTIQMCLDLIASDPVFEGHVPDIYRWRDEYDDPEVWDTLCRGDTIGVFQVETSTGTALTKKFGPRSLDDLCAILTLVRPGPLRSGLTESYLRRRMGLEAVIPAHPSLEDVLDKTYQSMIYQEDIMAVCRRLADYTAEEADEVRSILGKKKVERVQSEGVRFIERCERRGVERSVAEKLWAQMQEFAKYAFNRSHSWAYAMLAYQTAWLKTHFPVQFLTSVLTTVKKERIPDFVNAARASGFRVLPPDINESRNGFTVASDRMSVRYGLDSVKGIGEAAMRAILEGQPYTSFEDFLARKGRACNIGHIELLVRLGAFDSIAPHRAALERWIDQSKSGVLERCRWFDQTCNQDGLPCSFDWTSEVVLGKSGRPLKQRPKPTRCTKACRNYEQGESGVPVGVAPHSASVIRWRERFMLGVFLSSTPFDDVSPDVRSKCLSATDVERASAGRYAILGMVSRVKKHKDRANRDMAFVDLLTEEGSLSMTIFADQWARYAKSFTTDSLIFALVDKTDRGVSVVDAVNIPQMKEG